MGGNPDFEQFLFEDLSVFSDVSGEVVLISPGRVDRREMADRVYLVLVPRLGEIEFAARLAGPGASMRRALDRLSARCEYRSVRVDEQGVELLGDEEGIEVTVVSCAGIASVDELCE